MYWGLVCLLFEEKKDAGDGRGKTFHRGCLFYSNCMVVQPCDVQTRVKNRPLVLFYKKYRTILIFRFE
jgi:hypothetical protein